MLWSLIKILAFVAAVMVLTFGLARLTEVEGGATITAGGTEITLSTLELTLVLIALVVVLWLLFKLAGLIVATLRFINGDDNALSRYFSRNRERRGYQALSEGMLALALGEGDVAISRASRAERYLGRPELTNLLIAQGAEVAGDRRRAEATYKKLLTDERTRFVGIRGLLKQRLEAGDDETALKLAHKAFALKPKHTETQDILLRLQAESHDWAGARATLGAKLRSGSLPRDVYKRRDAVLALSEAADVISDKSSIEKREEAIEANRLSPDLIPAAVMAARGYIEAGNKRYATRVLRKTWIVMPHPDLAAAFAEIEPQEDPQARLKRFQVLTRSNPDDPETRMLLAELLIAAEDFPGARRALGDLPQSDPTARNLTLMAAIERGAGADEATVRGWLTRALTAPRGPQWVCDNCKSVHGAWMPVCSTCHGFDTLSWRRPTTEEIAMPAGTEMLPLIAGASPAAASGAAPATTPTAMPGTDAPRADGARTEPDRRAAPAADTTATGSGTAL